MKKLLLSTLLALTSYSNVYASAMSAAEDEAPKSQLVARIDPLGDIDQLLPAEIWKLIATFTEPTRESRGALASTCTVLSDLCREATYHEPEFFYRIAPIQATIVAFKPDHGVLALVTGGTDLTNTAIGQHVTIHSDKGGNLINCAATRGLDSLVGMHISTSKARRVTQEVTPGQGDVDFGITAAPVTAHLVLRGTPAPLPFQRRIWPIMIEALADLDDAASAEADPGFSEQE